MSSGIPHAEQERLADERTEKAAKLREILAKDEAARQRRMELEETKITCAVALEEGGYTRMVMSYRDAKMLAHELLSSCRVVESRLQHLT